MFRKLLSSRFYHRLALHAMSIARESDYDGFWPNRRDYVHWSIAEEYFRHLTEALREYARKRPRGAVPAMQYKWDHKGRGCSFLQEGLRPYLVWIKPTSNNKQTRLTLIRRHLELLEEWGYFPWINTRGIDRNGWEVVS